MNKDFTDKTYKQFIKDDALLMIKLPNRIEHLYKRIQQ